MHAYYEFVKKGVIKKRVAISEFAIVFFAFFVSSLFGYFTAQYPTLAPTAIYISPGIALAAVWILGYRALLSIALASLCSIFLMPNLVPYPLALTSIIVQTILPGIGYFLLHRFNFKGTFITLRETIAFVLVVIILSFIHTVVISLVQFSLQLIPSNAIVISLSRPFIGRLLSFMIITPFIVLWFPWQRETFKSMHNKLYLCLALLLLFIVSYFAFWTTEEEFVTFLMIVVLLGTLFWIALRLTVRKLTLGLFIISIFSMTGAFLSTEESVVTLSSRVFSIELFFILIGPIYLAFCSLLKERDITSKAVEEYLHQLESAMKKVSSQDDAKSEFLTILAHELRNPLAAILTTIELLSALESKSPQSQELLEVVADRVKTMSVLLEDLLDISRISRNKFELKKEVVLLSSIIKKSVTAVTAAAQVKEHNIAVNESSVPILIQADVTRLEQIIVNILNNAIKYTDRNGAISLTTEQEHATVIIKIKDNGIGIAPLMLSQIFDSFFQIKTMGRQTAGLGIGLALTKQLVELHGGTVRAYSNGIHTGSEFVIRLPTSQRLVSAPAQKHMLPNVAVAKKEKGLRILVVDDNEVAANSLAQLLDLQGHTVSIAYNGASAYEVALNFKPQVAILDIGMPDLDGYEIVALLKNEKFKCIYIALTGYGQLEDKKRALYSGFDFHLTKPAGLKQIEEILKKIPQAQLARLTDHRKNTLSHKSK